MRWSWSTSSTRFTNLNYWINDKTGFDYLVQIQVPPLRIDKPEDVEELPLKSINPVVPLMVRDVLKDGQVHTSTRPGEYDRDMSQRFLTVVANVEGEDLGRAAKQVRQAVEGRGRPAPRRSGSRSKALLPSMTEMFEALGIGLGVSVFVILVLLTAYFQSPRLAVISIGAVPGVLAGIATILFVTKTTLNIESFMGSIMCLGVSVSNSVMMVTFMDEHWKAGKSSAEAASDRREGTSAADLDDGLRDDGGHGADGAGAGAGKPDGVAPGPGRDRWTGDVDVRHAAGAPLFRAGDRWQGTHLRPRSIRGTRPARITMRNSPERRREAAGKVPLNLGFSWETCVANGESDEARTRPHARPTLGNVAPGPAGRDRMLEGHEGRAECVGSLRCFSSSIPRRGKCPQRGATQLRSELRADVDLSETQRLHRKVERGYRRQGAKGDVLADLFVPELREEWTTKKAMVEYDSKRSGSL